MALFKEYKPGNLIHYTEGLFPPEVCEIVSVSKEKLQLRAVKSGQPYEVLFDDDEKGQLHPIWLDTKSLTALGFKQSDNYELKMKTWKNDRFEIIAEVTEPAPNFKGSKVRDIARNMALLTIDDDYRDVEYVHELQNIYSNYLGRTLDVSGLSDIRR